MSSKQTTGVKRIWAVLLCAVATATLATAAYADDDRGRGHGEKHHDERRSWTHDRQHDRWSDGRHHDRRRDRDHDHHRRGQDREWGYHSGRYWAPAHYRGRQCSDRRHHHGVHYHVLARDYYEHYYPRYRYYGPRPLDASASVIITLPLF